MSKFVRVTGISGKKDYWINKDLITKIEPDWWEDDDGTIRSGSKIVFDCDNWLKVNLEPDALMMKVIGT